MVVKSNQRVNTPDINSTKNTFSMEDSGRGASYTVPCDDYVHVVEFSPFDSGSAASLLAYGGNQYVVVGTCRFQEEDMEVEGVEFTTLRVFHHALRVDCLAWSPESRLDKLPQLIRFCTAAADRKVRLLTSDLQNQHEVKVMEGHTSYINHLVFEPTEGKQMASVSDDHTCRVWDLEGNETTTFRLRSPGVSVCWHPEDAFKLMVAEKKGTIRFYDLVTQQAILSLDCGQSPLMSADWCLTNTIKVGAVTGSDWVIWDITRSSYPQEKRPAHVERAGNFRWSRVNENLFSTTGCPGKISSQLLVHHLGHPQPVMIGSATVGAGLSWHRSLPLCVIGGDRKLSFWMTEM
ncbi:nucleoporin Nup37-like isoform X2 [Salvelinus namaycush]|uniref:Nucleoporin Nup37 n=1 Tax=Salvelinus namaycush TaxID=8040 RepID=A0A8U0QXX0_SALNM|nr:nucleoporin Nup37-like isoform X2 [Salvelinus namaycush]